MSKRIIIGVLLLCAALQLKAQDCTIRFGPAFEGEQLVLNKYYHLPNGDSISFSLFKCYISGVLINDANDKRVVSQSNYHLLDMEDTGTMVIPHVLKQGKISFNIGVDSLMSVSGAMPGDLDPEKGMYWAWQSGYINFKIEGKCNKVPARNHEFQYHVGGYAGKDNALQRVHFHAALSGKNLLICIELSHFFESIDMAKQYAVMIPGPEAVQLAQRFAKCFYLVK